MYSEIWCLSVCRIILIYFLMSTLLNEYHHHRHQELRMRVFGAADLRSFSLEEWLSLPFSFNEAGSPQAYGLRVHSSSTKGLAMCVQAYLLKHLLFSHMKSSGIGDVAKLVLTYLILVCVCVYNQPFMQPTNQSVIRPVNLSFLCSCIHHLTNPSVIYTFIHPTDC